MDSITPAEDFRFPAEHFASEYERYAALVLSRVPRIGAPALAHVFTDWERRDLLMLPERGANRNQRRLDPDEIVALTLVLRERDSMLLALGEFSAPVFRNVGVLGERLGLTAADRAVLVLAVLCGSVQILRDPFERLGLYLRDRPAVARAVAALLGLADAAVLAALDPDGTLSHTGLLRVNLHDEDEPLLAARAGLAPILFDELDAADALVGKFASRTRPATLTATDFAHLANDVAIVAALLASASREAQIGINVMLYGPPGTGKSELSRVLAAQAGLTLHEVRHSTDSGESMTHARYSQLIVAQQLLRPARSVALTFDEAEDLLPGRNGCPDASGERLGKAAFNSLLETNPVPTLWISNEIAHIDPAYLRRFAYVLEVKTPSRAVRRRIAQRELGDIVQCDAWIDGIAEHAALAPGQVAQAARVARLLRAEFDPAVVAERSMRNSMRAMRQSPADPKSGMTAFDLSYLNCSVDVAALVANLAARPSGTLVFYGPPGTGKTALARHIAQAADRPCVVKRVSDLQSPWVGVCERNIAAAFEEAADDGAVLLLDEAESFLADRRDARARWELSETNELLAQMDRFDGLFICTTNLVDRLDRAALRRFAIKIRFDHLRPPQAQALVAMALHGLAGKCEDAAALASVERLRHLTAGDVAAVVRRFRMLGQKPSAQAFVAALCHELTLKGEGAAQSIGF
jgi:transitional endoplasmic reticulum ATPase